MGNFIFDLQRFADDVTINADETYPADGVTYTAITAAQLNVDDDGAVTGIASGSVAATVTGADTSPTVTFDASDGAIDFTASSDGITITVTQLVPIEFVSGEFAYKGNTLTAGANSVAAFSVQLDNYVFSDEDTFESGGTYTFNDTGFVLESDHVTSLYTLTNGTDVRRIQVDSYGKVSGNFDDIGFTLHAGSSEVLTIDNYTLTATAIEDSVINFDLTEDGIMLLPNSGDGGVKVSLKRGDLKVFGGVLNVTGGSITFGYDNAVTFAAGTSFTLEQYGYTFSATTTDKATTAIELTDTGISFTPGTDDGGLQVSLSKGDTPIFGGVLNVTGGTISFNPATQKFSFTEGTNIALTLLNDTSRKFDIKVVDAAAAFRVEADTSGNLTLTPDSGDGSLEVTYTKSGDTPLSQTVKVSLDGSIVFNPATQSLTLTNGTTASVDLNNYTVTAIATDDASVSIRMTDAGLAITPQDGDGSLDVSITRGNALIFRNTIEISGGSIVFNPATQALTLTDGTSVSVVMNDYLALSATANGDATSAISFTDGGISVTPNQGDGALDITLSTPVGSLPAGIEVLSGSFTLGQGGSITVAKDTEIQVSFFDEYIVNFKTTDDASVSISMTEAGFAITPQDGDGSLDVSITRGNALIFRNNISISNGSVVWNPVAQTMTLTDGTSVSVVMNDKYTLTMTADGDAASKVVLTDNGISVTPNQSDGTLNISLTTPNGSLSADIEVLSGSFTLKAGGAITVAKDTEMQVKFSDNYTIDLKATDEAGVAIRMTDAGLAITPQDDDGSLDISIIRGTETIFSNTISISGGSIVFNPATQLMTLTDGTSVSVSVNDYYTLTMTADGDAASKVVLTDGGISVTPNQGDGTLNISLTTPNGSLSADIEVLSGSFTLGQDGTITVEKDTETQITFANGYTIDLKATDEAGGQLSFVGDGGLRFAPNDGDGKLDLNFVDTGRKATIDVSGAVVLGTDATIALEEGTVADIEWESGTQLKVSAIADGGSIGLEDNKLKISGNGELSIDFSTTAGIQTQMSDLVGTIYYDAGKVLFDEDSKITATSTLGGQPINITLESNGVGGYLDISANGTNYVAGTGALKITWSRDGKESSFAVNSGSVYIGHGIFEIAEGTDLSTDLKDLVPALNFTTSDAGEYTINGQTITTSAANMAMTATDDRMTFKPGSDIVEYDGMLFTGDGNVSLTQDGVILGAGIEATGFGLSNSFILNEEGNVTVDSRIFELTEDVPTGITVTGAQDGFIFSRTNTEESEARMDDPDSANVGKIFTEEFFLSNDDSYSVQTDLLGLQKIIGVTAPATVNATAIFGGESTRTIFDLVTETEGVFTVGDKPYTIGGDSSVGIKTAFDTTATGVRGFDDLLGTVNGDFTEFPISINGGKSIIIAGDSSIDLVATESGIELYNVSGGASLIEVAGVSKVHTDSEGTFTFGNGQDDTIAITILDDDSVTFGLNDEQYVKNIDDIEGNIIFSETSNYLSVNGMSGTFDGEFSSLAASSSIIFIHDIQDGSSFKTADDEDKFWLQLLGGSFAFNDNNLTLTNDNNGVWIRGKNVLGLETNASLQVSEAGTYVVNFFSTLEAQAGDIIVGTANSGARIYDEHYIENISSDTLVTGTADADTIINSGTAVTIQALDGDDFISNEVDSSVTAAEFGNSINAGDGNDTIYNYHTYNPTLLGGAGDDSIVVSSGHQTFADGGDGDDTIRGVQATVSSGNGWHMGGYATILGGAGDDLIDTGYSNNSSINGGDGDDTIVANGASATIDGGDGSNLIQLTTIEGGATGQYITLNGDTTVEGFGTGFGEGTDTIIDDVGPNVEFQDDALIFYNSNATLTLPDVTTSAKVQLYHVQEDKLAGGVFIAENAWHTATDDDFNTENLYYVGASGNMNHGVNFNGISDTLNVTLNTDYQSTVTSMWINGVYSIIGGAGKTTITGSTLSDTIIAGDGATTINAGAGGDKLFGNGKTVFNVDKGATTTINGSAGDTINVGDDNYTFETDGTVYIAGGSLASYSRQTILKSGDEYLTGNDNLAYVNGNSVTLTADDTELIVGKRGGTISGYDFNKTTYITGAASFADLVQSIRTDQFEFDAGTFHAVGQRDVVLEGVDTSKGTFLIFQSNDEVKGLFGWSGKLDGVVDGSDIDKSQILLSASKGGTITLRGGSKGDTIYSGEGDVVSVSGGHDTVHVFANNGSDVTFDLGDGSTNGIMEVVDELGLAAYVVKVDDTDDLNLRMVDDRLTFRKGNSRVVFDEATSFADANGLQVQVGDEVYTVRSDYSGGMSGVDYFWAGEGDLYYKPDTSLYLHDDNGTREYHITEGSGRATIDGFNYGVYGDTVFIDEIDNMRQVGDDVAIVSGSGDRVLIKDGANKIYNVVYDGSHYVAEIGSSLTYNAWVDVYGGGTGGNTVSVGADYSGNEVAVYMNGAAEVGGKEKYYFGVDKIDASAYGGQASLIGGVLDDTIIAAQGATSLWGGDSGNDVLHGTGSGNEFFYFRGNGRDVIRDAADGDVVNLYDVTLDDISATAINSSQASIEFKVGGSVTFDSAADATFKLGDGSTWKANHQSNEWQQE